MAPLLHIKANATTGIILLATLLFMLPQAKCQPVISIGKVSACVGSEVVVPVEVIGFKDVAAITLFIQFDTTAVSFISLDNFNQALSGGSLVNSVQYTQNLSSINISWASMVSATINKESLFTIRVMLKSDSTHLSFRPDCEIALSDLSVIGDMVYNDGTISPWDKVTPEPQFTRVDEGSTAQFVLPLLIGAPYQWQQNVGLDWVDCTEGNLFAGVKTNELLVKSVKPELNNSKYRCLMQHNSCTQTSEESILQVSAVGLAEQMSEQNSLLVVNPNPVGEQFTFSIGKTMENASLRLLDCQGKILFITDVSPGFPGTKHSMKMDNYIPGLYVLQLFDGKRFVASVKLIHKL